MRPSPPRASARVSSLPTATASSHGTAETTYTRAAGRSRAISGLPRAISDRSRFRVMGRCSAAIRAHRSPGNLRVAITGRSSSHPSFDVCFLFTFGVINFGGGSTRARHRCCVSKPGCTTPSVAAEARRRSVERHGPTATPPSTEMEKKKNLSLFLNEMGPEQESSICLARVCGSREQRILHSTAHWHNNGLAHTHTGTTGA